GRWGGRGRGAVDSRTFRRRERREEFQMYGESELRREGGAEGRAAAVARSRRQWLAAVCAGLQICSRRDLGVHVAVESGMQTTDRFDLCGQDLLAQKTALLRQRNPKLPDVAQSLATYRINSDP